MAVSINRSHPVQHQPSLDSAAQLSQIELGDVLVRAG